VVEITITTTPQSVRVLLNLDDVREQVLWAGRAQNRGRSSVYRLRAATAPDPAAVRGWKHPSGDVWPMTVYGDDVGATWLWTREGTATVVLDGGA